MVLDQHYSFNNDNLQAIIELLYIRVVGNMTKKFQRKIENFTCEHCGAEVVGNGYTDHCPVCLWGKHVDINPGDRAAECGGAMEPIGMESKNNVLRIKYRCRECGHEFTVKAAIDDNMDAMIKISNSY